MSQKSPPQRAQDGRSAALRWRPGAPDDLPAIAAVAARVHPDYPEENAVFAERLRLYPAGCRLLVAGDGAAAGYVVSHPWTYGAPPALGSRLGALPAAADSYYIHDLALLPAARGRGAAAEIVAALCGWAATEAFATVALIAIAGTQAFWERQGFHRTDLPDLADKLASYDPSACYMTRRTA